MVIFNVKQYATSAKICFFVGISKLFIENLLIRSGI